MYVGIEGYRALGSIQGSGIRTPSKLGETRGRNRSNLKSRTPKMAVNGDRTFISGSKRPT